MIIQYLTLFYQASRQRLLPRTLRDEPTVDVLDDHRGTDVREDEHGAEPKGEEHPIEADVSNVPRSIMTADRLSLYAAGKALPERTGSAL